MKQAIFGLVAVVVMASSTGCCCFDKLFCCGSRGCGYGHEGPGSCGGGGCSSCGGGGVDGGCADCGMASNEYDGAPGAGGMARNGGRHHVDGGHPMVQQRRNAGGEHQFQSGPPTGGVSYPYYTNRGPRDFLAKNPRGIGP